MRTNRPGLFAGLRRLYGHLNLRRRWQLRLLIVLMAMGALAELMSLGAVVPFVSVLVSPERLAENAYVRQAMAATGLSLAELPVAISLAFGALTVLSALLRLALLRASLRFSYGVGHELSSSLYGKTLQRPYVFHVRKNSSEIIGAVNKVQELVGGYVVPAMNGFIALVLASAILFTLIAIDPLIAIAAASGFGISYFCIAVIVRGRLTSAGQTVSLAHNQRIQSIQEGLGAIRDVILDRSHGVFLNKFAKQDREFSRAQSEGNFLGSAPRILIEAIGMLVLVGFSLAFSSSGGGLTGLLPVLGALAVGAQKLLPLVQQIYAGWSAIVTRQAVLADVLELVEYRPEESEVGPLPFLKEIRLDAVDFSFSPGPESPSILTGITLTIRKGEKIGIIGATGSGKSTVLDLLMGLLTPSAGEVVIDSQPLTLGNTAAWQRHIAHVPQAIYLSDGSISENIAFGVPGDQIDMERVVGAARIAQIDDHIASLPQGYGTQVGERGIRLSGGQRQRIGIARALYRKADVLILDEATSALDEATEAVVIESIHRLASNPTLIMIAHRLSTLKYCDRVIELDRGGVVDVLTFQALRERHEIQPAQHAYG